MRTDEIMHAADSETHNKHVLHTQYTYNFNSRCLLKSRKAHTTEFRAAMHACSTLYMQQRLTSAQKAQSSWKLTPERITKIAFSG